MLTIEEHKDEVHGIRTNRGYRSHHCSCGCDFLCNLGSLWIQRLEARLQVLEYEGRKDSARAIEILKERYAKGEITKEQYERMIRELEQHP